MEREKYMAIFWEWIDKKYMRIVPEEETRTKDAYYLPHFPVFKGQAPNRKIRPIMDATAKYKGRCLNDHLLTGPNYMQDLSKVLLRFRAR